MLAHITTLACRRKHEREFAELLAGGAKSSALFLRAEIDLFYRYMNLIEEWNERFNLTAISGHDMVVKHFLDSLSIVKYFPRCGNSWMSGQERDFRYPRDWQSRICMLSCELWALGDFLRK